MTALKFLIASRTISVALSTGLGHHFEAHIGYYILLFSFMHCNLSIQLPWAVFIINFLVPSLEQWLSHQRGRKRPEQNLSAARQAPPSLQLQSCYHWSASRYVLNTCATIMFGIIRARKFSKERYLATLKSTATLATTVTPATLVTTATLSNTMTTATIATTVTMVKVQSVWLCFRYHGVQLYV